MTAQRASQSSTPAFEREARPRPQGVGRLDPSGWADEIGSALRVIDQRDAAALRLIYGSRLTHQQAARNLGLPESEVKTRVARGMYALASLLSPRPTAQHQAEQGQPRLP